MITILVPSISAAASCLLSWSIALTTPLGVLDLVDRVLELLVEHASVGDDDDAVEHLVVLAVVQARQPVREPRDAVGLSASGRVLDQVVPARPLAAGRRHELPHGIELVVAREDQRFLGDASLAALAVVDLLLLLLDEHEVAEDVEEAVALKHLLPEVARAVARRMLRVAGAALDLARMAAAVEGQEECVLAAQPRRHVHLVRIGGEMHQRAAS